MSAPRLVADVVTRMREIDAELPPDDGVAVFNRIYLTVTERVAEILDGTGGDAPAFRDSPTMAELDVRFARLWLQAYDAAATGARVPAARDS